MEWHVSWMSKYDWWRKVFIVIPTIIWYSLLFFCSTAPQVFPHKWQLSSAMLQRNSKNNTVIFNEAFDWTSRQHAFVLCQRKSENLAAEDNTVVVFYWWNSHPTVFDYTGGRNSKEVSEIRVLSWWAASCLSTRVLRGAGAGTRRFTREGRALVEFGAMRARAGWTWCGGGLGRSNKFFVRVTEC